MHRISVTSCRSGTKFSRGWVRTAAAPARHAVDSIHVQCSLTGATLTCARKHSSSTGISRTLLKQYGAYLAKWPLSTKMITSGVICASGDCMCQLLWGEPIPTASDFDGWRTLRFLLTGAFVVAPTMHMWFGFLSRTFPGVSMAATVQKVAADQLIMAPVFNPARVCHPRLSFVPHDTNMSFNCVCRALVRVRD